MAGENDNTPKYVGQVAIQRVIDNVKTLLGNKQDTLTFDTTPTASSTNPVTSGGILLALTGNGISAIANHGLSQEDFTSTLKTKLDGIEAGAEVNDVTDVQINSTSIISNKVANFVTKTAYNSSTNKIATESDLPTKTSDLNNDSGFITKSVNDLTNYYTTSNTYTKTEVDALIGAIPNVTISIVTSLPTASATYYFNDSKTIYMVRNSASTGTDFYEEYICLRSGTEGSYTYSWEKIGDTQIDLSGYVPTSRKVNNKALTSDITLSASDVGALPSNTTYVSSVKSIDTTATTAQSTSASEAISGSGTITFHKVAKTGSYNDLLNKPTIPTDTNQKIKTSSVTFGNDDVVQITAGSNVQVAGDATNKTITISATDTTYSSQSASQGGTAVSLVTTGEKYTWNNKQDAMTAITAEEIDAMF